MDIKNTKDALLSYKRKPLPVEVPEVGEMHVRVMSAMERFDWFKETDKHEDDSEKNMHRLLVRCLSNPDGTRLFPGDSEQEIEKAVDQLRPVDSVALDQLNKAALKYNHFLSEEKDKIAKNSASQS